MCHSCHPILYWFWPFWPFLDLFWPYFGPTWSWISEKNHNQYIPSGCLLLQNSKRFIKNCHQNATFFGLCFGQIWPSLVQIFGPDNFKMSKIKFLNTWNLLWLLSVVFCVNPNCYIPPSNRKCNVQCMVALGLAGKPLISFFAYPILLHNHFLALCKEDCVHGTCVEPDSCQCFKGWSGNTCNKCIKMPGCMNGDCIDTSNACFCHEGKVIDTKYH